MPFRDAPPQSESGENSERRVALVIGNGGYAGAPVLSSALSDAKAIASALGRLGFDVMQAVNVDLGAMRAVLAAFEEKLRANPDVAVLFYAGHSLWAEGENYLLPIDARITQETDLSSRTLHFTKIYELMAARASASLIFLDACQDNALTSDPLVRAGLTSVPGLAGTFVAYAAEPNTVTYAGIGINSPFTRALLKHIETPGLSIDGMMAAVRSSVLLKTGGRQRPWDQSILRSQFYFVPLAPTPPLPAPMIEAETEWSAVGRAANLDDPLSFRDRDPEPQWGEHAGILIAEPGAASEEPLETVTSAVELRDAIEDRRDDSGPVLTAPSGAEEHQPELLEPVGPSGAPFGASIGESAGAADEDAVQAFEDPLLSPPLFLKAKQTFSTAGDASLTPDSPAEEQPGKKQPPWENWRAAAAGFAIVAASIFGVWIILDGDVAPPVKTELETAFPPQKPLDAEPSAAAKVDPPAERWTQAAPTRFVIGLEGETPFKIYFLPDPDRVVVEILSESLSLPSALDSGPRGLVRSFQAGVMAPQRSRVIIHVTAPVTIQSATFQKAANGDKTHLVIDIVAKDETPTALDAVQPPIPKPAVPSPRFADKAYKPVIVIDPGHGGRDSGAQTRGAIEKEAVLAFSKVLKAKLEASGRYKVLMTREADDFVSLPERREFAERNGAELFITLHASDSGAQARGVTIKSLHDPSEEAQLAAKREAAGGASNIETGAMNEADDTAAVGSFLKGLAENMIAATGPVTESFVAGLGAQLKGDGSLVNDGKEANYTENKEIFLALKSAKIPSVLIQLANIKNKSEADALTSKERQNKTSDSFVAAIDTFFSQSRAAILQ